ncbi:MAG: proprotein convertase P-domain-containing protein [Flavobacteriaceae bacterium]|nr:proprotein convertase P-domain-containing protein [Flavobacteriaceae bacterium]
MPQLETVVGGAVSSLWEVTPSIARNMNFLMTIRDNNTEAGQLATDNVTITVSDLAGPFKVTSQNLANIVWEKNATQTILWDVAGTNANGVNASAVNILLSTDGGKNFNTVLKSNTPNDGSENIIVPQTGAIKCFVMVEALNNIFYAVNTKSFSIGNFVETCNDYASVDIPKNIPDNNLSGVTSSLPVSDNINIESISVTAKINHPFAADLTLFLTNPQGKTIKLLQNECFNLGANIDAVFSDTGADLVCGSSQLVISGNIKPEESLSVFNGGNTLGTWQLKVVDNGVADIGSIVSWGLKICSSKEVVAVGVSNLTNFVLYPNPTENYFTVEFTSDEPGDVGVTVYDLLGRQILHRNFQNSQLNFKETLSLNGINKGYLPAQGQQRKCHVFAKIGGGLNFVNSGYFPSVYYFFYNFFIFFYQYRKKVYFSPN